MICSWCRKDYSCGAIFHICDDGTNFSERSLKTMEETMTEHERQDRVKEANKIMESPAPLVSQRPSNVELKLTKYDLDMLKAMKIKV